MSPNGCNYKISGKKLLELAIFSVNIVVSVHHECRPYKEDMVSHALLKWYEGRLDQRIDSSRSDEEIRHYVLITFKHRMEDFCFKCRRRREISLDDLSSGVGEDSHSEEGIPPLVEIETPCTMLEKKKMLYALEDAINRLPRAQKAAFIKRELKGMSNQELAQSEGIREAGASQNYKRAIRKLKKDETLEEFI